MSMFWFGVVWGQFFVLEFYFEWDQLFGVNSLFSSFILSGDLHWGVEM